MTNAAFAKAVGRFLAALRYRRRGRDLEYLRVNEWRHGVQHTHLLLRVADLSRDHVRGAAENAGLAATLSKVRNVEGIARYIVKDVRRTDGRAELAPASFKGKLYTTTRNFLSAPMGELWKSLREEARTRRERSSAAAAGPRGRANA